MALITKATVASVLGILDADIPQSIYDWGLTQFYALTGLKSADEEKVHTEFVNSTKCWIKLPDRNIKSIDTLKIDNEEITFTLFTDLKFNPQTGLVNYSGGFGGGQLVQVEYTVSAFTAKTIHDYLISLLVIKGLSIFTPDKIGQVKTIKIGKYQKQFGNVATNLDDYVKSLNDEILYAIGLIAGDDGQAKFAAIL